MPTTLGRGRQRLRVGEVTDDQLDRGAEFNRNGNFSAGLLAHEVGEPSRQLAFVGFRKAAEQHVRNDEAKYVVAEKLKPLIGASVSASRGLSIAEGSR